MKSTVQDLSPFLLIGFLLLIAGKAVSQVDFWQQMPGLDGIRVLVLATNSTGDVFAGSDSGRVYRKLHTEAQWQPIEFGQPRTRVRAIIFDSTETTFILFSSRWLFYSPGDVDEWKPMNLGVPGGQVSTIAINSDNHLFAGTFRNGLYRSSDRGESWTASCCPERFVYFVATTSNRTAFAATNCCELAGNRTGSIFRTTTNGESWMRVFTDYSDFVSGTTIWQVRTNGNDDVVALASAGILRSTDNGETWTVIDEDLQKRYNIVLAINSEGDVYASTSAAGVFQFSSKDEEWSTTC